MYGNLPGEFTRVNFGRIHQKGFPLDSENLNLVFSPFLRFVKLQYLLVMLRRTKYSHLKIL